MEDCIFCKIIKGKIPAEKVYEDEKTLVIMDLFPGSKGQCLVIPKEHSDYLFNIDDNLYHYLFTITKKIVKAIDKSLKPIRTCLLVEGFDVPHAHIRIHPAYKKCITINGEKASEQELKEVAKEIKKEIS